MYGKAVSRRAAVLAVAFAATACAHAPPEPLSDPPFPAAKLVLRAPARVRAVLGPTRLAVRLRNDGDRWARLELDPKLLQVEGRDAAGKPLLCLAPRRAGPRAPRELGPGEERTLVIHLEDRCAVAAPGSYLLLLRYEAPATGGAGAWSAGPVEVRLEVAPRPTPAEEAAARRRACVERELSDRGLNAYGDPPGTVYTGGTPLFDEKTGRREDRLDHVLARVPAIAAACPATPGS